MTRNEYVEKLSAGICTVVFNKVSGGQRTIRGTLNSEYDEAIDKNTKVLDEYNNYPKHLVPIFDLDIKEWRSFVADSVVSFDESN
jgi:hypothetical protein